MDIKKETKELVQYQESEANHLCINKIIWEKSGMTGI